MANSTNALYSVSADLNLWLKIQSGDDYMLSDFSGLLPYRWTWFRDNWEFYKGSVIAKLSLAENPSLVKQQIDDLSQYIEIQRYNNSNINPFDGANIFYRFYLVLEQIPVDSAPISDKEQELIDSAVNKVKGFSKNDFIAIKNSIIKFRDLASDQANGMDSSYDEVFNRSASPSLLNPSISELNNQLQYQNMIKTVDFILANQYSAVSSLVDPFALAKANANNPDIDIPSYKSGKLVKINYGEDLRALAKRYLGDADKWIDIAITNGLKPPYIDEVGTRLPIIANASSNIVNISETDVNGKLNIDKFYINQIIILQSDTEVFPDQRIILNIKQIPVSGEILLELSGEHDLDKYKTVDNANIRIFAPNTANSQFMVMIPSMDPLGDSPSLDTPWFLRTSGEDEKRAKIDLALNENMDISFSSSGDLNLSYGLANHIQAIKLKLLVELGELQRHPEYGFIVIQGSTNKNIASTKSTIVKSLNRQIELDPRFDRVESLDVEYFGAGVNGAAGYSITMEVRLAGGAKTLPISFNVNVA